MKTYLNLGLILTFVLFITSCIPYPTDVEDCGDWCSNPNISALSSVTQGDCMSLCNTCNNPSESAANQAVCICNFYENNINSWNAFSGTNLTGNQAWIQLGALLGAPSIKNKGKCVNYFKDQIENGGV